VLGSAVALKLLFGLPLLAGVLLTGLDVLIVLALQGRGFRWVEAMVITLIATIAACFVYEIFISQPLWREAAVGLIPTADLLRNRQMLYLSIGILGATVMPHNLYLHSSIVQTRAFGRLVDEKREAVRYAIFDSTVALGFAFFINAAILVLGAAVFHSRGLTGVADISQAYQLLSPALGAGLASTIFAAALLCSGQNSTLTGTLAGQIVMEGFLHLRLKPWLRRLITRSLAIVPAALVIGIAGERQATNLLILSQVILSFQLPFAVVPLIQFTNDRSKMGEFANRRWVAMLAWIVAVAIIALNALLLVLVFRGQA
jgi:manganese transport protein